VGIVSPDVSVEELTLCKCPAELLDQVGGNIEIAIATPRPKDE
jgi:hypothetical protein